MQFRLGELFCGAGGLALGAVRAGSDDPIEHNGERFTITHAWANDSDPAACRTYAANLLLDGLQDEDAITGAITPVEEWVARRVELPEGRAAVLSGSIEELATRIADLPPIDGLAFGFPCNDFSAVGERKGLQGDFGPLYAYGVQALETHRPRWFVAENVVGLLHRDNGREFERILTEVRAAGPGYEVTSHVYSFQQYGVPQSRKRLIMVGVARPDVEEGIRFRVPAPTQVGPPLTAEWGLTHDPFNPEVLLPLTPPRLEGCDTFHNHRLSRMNERVRRRLEHTLPGQNAWNATIPSEFALNVQNAHLSQIYRRLRHDEPSYTITGNGGGGTHGYHWAEPRALTNRERARLQSFPDAFVFHGGESDVRRQIGMAVPPLAAKVIFEAILKTFARVPYDHIPSTLGGIAQRRLEQLELRVSAV